MKVRTIALGVLFAAATLVPALAQSVRIAHPQLGVIISDQGGQTVGEVADILRAVATYEKIDLVFVPLTKNTAETLEGGDADAVAPYLATSADLQKYDFTKTLMTSGGGLYVRAPNTAPSDVGTLAGKTVVTPSFGPFVSYIRKNFPNVKVVVAGSYQESLDRVLAGEADAAALNVQEASSVIARSYAGKISVPAAPFLSESLVLAVLKGQHPELIQRVNDGLAAIRVDGTMAKIEAKWNPQPRGATGPNTK
jgi:polar amino acid transport system substrate-binding protein